MLKNDHNGQGCKGFEYALLFSAEDLKQIMLAVRLRRHLTLKNQRLKITQHKKARFIEVNELKLTEVELF